MACRVRGISSSYRRSGSSPACRRSTSVAKRDERGRTRALHRALGLRVRGIYSTKDTFVTTALKAGVKVAWLENQTGVSYATLKRHYGKWFYDGDDTELRRFESLDPSL